MGAINWILTVLLISILVTGCGQGASNATPVPTFTLVPTSAPLPTAPPSTETPQTTAPAPTQTTGPADTPVPPTPEGTPPAAGTGNLMGRILWNEQPVNDLELKLCDDVSLVHGCIGEAASTRSDEWGNYRFADIPPGDYSLVVHALDTDRWLYVTSGLGPGARKYTVLADQNRALGDHHIYKFDLQITSPDDNAQIEAETPTLAWEPYPEAASYGVYLTPETGQFIFLSQRTDGNQISPQAPLLACKYTWKVEAFNANGIKIAETDGFYDFEVAGPPVSCYVQLISPYDGATLSGSDVVLSWEPHPLAAFYTILMWNDTAQGRPKVLDFEQVREARYAFSHSLDPARYVWSVRAFDADSEEIGGSQTSGFTVSGP